MSGIMDRFWSKVDRGAADECWIWTAAAGPYGHGAFWSGEKIVRPYRFLYELEIGPVPDGLELDHLCGEPRCVNPAHLEAVTHEENVRRGKSGQYMAERTHCKNGHEWSEENTIWKRSKGRRNPFRFCRACQRDRDAKRKAAA